VRCEGADLYEDGLLKVGSAGLYQAIFLSADPNPPDEGDNVWAMETQDLDGSANSELQVQVNTYMPFHGHGGSTVTIEEGGGDGRYTLATNLFMAGLWEIRIDVEDGDGNNDRITFAFCVEG
jgi:hypothetical protein